jgi:ketosteroid isomerase-like protein
VTDSANVELVRSIYAAWERGDHSSADWAHPDIEWVGADGLRPSAAKGLVEMASRFRDWLSAWEDWRVAADEYLELDAERVFVSYHFTARGKASGVEIGAGWSKGAQVFHVRDGRVIKLVQYNDRDNALADLRLPKEGGSP